MKSVRAGSGGLPLDDGDFHVLDLDADQQEVDLAHDHIFQVIPVEKTNKQIIWVSYSIGTYKDLWLKLHSRNFPSFVE